jgi:hypothetical protein
MSSFSTNLRTLHAPSKKNPHLILANSKHKNQTIKHLQRSDFYYFSHGRKRLFLTSKT